MRPCYDSTEIVQAMVTALQADAASMRPCYDSTEIVTVSDIIARNGTLQ